MTAAFAVAPSLSSPLRPAGTSGGSKGTWTPIVFRHAACAVSVALTRRARLVVERDVPRKGKELAAGGSEEALRAFGEALSGLEADSLEFAKIQMSIGVLHSQRGDFQAALEAYESAKLQRRSKNGARLRGNIAMAKFHLASGDWEDVVQSFSEAIELFRQQKLIESKEGVRLLLLGGKAKEELGDVEQALLDYKEARAILERAGATGSKVGIEMLERMSDAQFELDDLESAEANLVMAVEKTEAKGTLDSPEGARLLQKLGDLQTELNGVEEALTSYRSARQILEDHGLLHGVSAACLLANMATLEADSLPSSEAIQSFGTAKKLFLEAKALESEEYADLLMNLGVQHLKAGQVDLALKHLEDAKRVFQSKGLLDSMVGAKLWTNLGSALLQRDSSRDFRLSFRLSSSAVVGDDSTLDAQEALSNASLALEALVFIRSRPWVVPGEWCS